MTSVRRLLAPAVALLGLSSLPACAAQWGDATATPRRVRTAKAEPAPAPAPGDAQRKTLEKWLRETQSARLDGDRGHRLADRQLALHLALARVDRWADDGAPSPEPSAEALLDAASRALKGERRRIAARKRRMEAARRRRTKRRLKGRRGRGRRKAAADRPKLARGFGKLFGLGSRAQGAAEGEAGEDDAFGGDAPRPNGTAPPPPPPPPADDGLPGAGSHDRRAAGGPHGGSVEGARVRTNASPAGVGAAVSSRLGAITACLPAHASWAMRIDVQLMVGPDGSFRESRAHHPSLDPRATGCIADALNGMRLPAYKGETRAVRFPLHVPAR